MRPARPKHVEPWEPNATAMHDPSRLKWRDLVEPGTPLPTPWDKEAYEKQSRESQARRRKLLASGAPQSEIDKLFREEEDVVDEAAGRNEILRQGRRLRRRVVRSEGIVQARGRLHHVHARSGRVLPCLPARHRARDRPVRTTVVSDPGWRITASSGPRIQQRAPAIRWR